MGFLARHSITSSQVKCSVAHHPYGVEKLQEYLVHDGIKIVIGLDVLTSRLHQNNLWLYPLCSRNPIGTRRICVDPQELAAKVSKGWSREADAELTPYRGA